MRDFFKLLPLLCFVTTIASAANLPKYFAVWLKNGQRVDLLLTETPRVTCGAETFIFKAGATTLEYLTTDVKEFTLEDKSATSINNVSKVKNFGTIARDGNMLRLSGFAPNETVRVCKLSGEQEATYVTDSDGSLIFSIDNLGRGIYVVNAASTTIKITQP